MDEKLRRLLDETPERPPRSKLEPHAAVIRELRKKRRTYTEIAAFFREHLQLSVAPSTIHDFVKTRARQARNREATPAESPANPAPTAEPWPSAVSESKPPLSETDVQDRIRALKAALVPSAKEPALFHFDPQEPLALPPQPIKPKEK